TCCESARFAVERVVSAVLWIEPGNFGFADVGTIGIDGSIPVIDHNLPGRAAYRISAGDCRLALLAGAGHRDGQTSRENRCPGRQNSVAKHDRVSIPLRRSIYKTRPCAKQAVRKERSGYRCLLNFCAGDY